LVDPIEFRGMESPAQVIATPDSQAESFKSAWIQLAWYGTLLFILFAPVIIVMVKEWATDESMGHGFFVPLVSGYIIWQRRHELRSITPKPHWSGWIFMILGFVFLGLGTFGAEFFVMRVGFMTSLLGVLLLTCGWPIVRALAFPLVLLLFMIRIPLFLYSRITFPLQLFASAVAERSIDFLGIPVLREGNVLKLPSQDLDVVGACSGIRSLLSLTYLSLVYGYFFEKKTWMRVVLFLATIPIAIISNAARVTLTGLVSEYDTALAKGLFHTFEGWVIFMVALGALILTHYILNLVYSTIRRPQQS